MNRRIQKKIIGEAFQVAQALLRAEGLPPNHGYPPRLVRLLSPLREILLGAATTTELRERIQALRTRGHLGGYYPVRGAPWSRRGRTYAWHAGRGFGMALSPFRAVSGPLTRPGPPAGTINQIYPVQVEIPVGADCAVEVTAQQELLGVPGWSLHVYPQAALGWGGVTCEGIQPHYYPETALEDTGLLGNQPTLPLTPISVGQRFHFRFRNSSPFPVQITGVISLTGGPIPAGWQFP